MNIPSVLPIPAIPTSYLLLLISSGEIPALIRYLGCPHSIRVEDDETAARIKADIASILHRLTDQPALRRMFQLHVVSGLLLSGTNPSRIADILSRCPDYPLLFPQIPFERLTAGKWLSIPVIGMDHQKACFRYWIAGMLPSSQFGYLQPDWTHAVMDSSARTAAADAAAAAMHLSELAEGLCLAGYPLVLPNSHIQIRSHSLGLPLALGYCGLTSESAHCRHLVASGAITPTGTVCAVAGIQSKISLAAQAGYRLFVYPSDCGPLRQPEGMELAPVSHLEEADLLARLHFPGNLPKLILFDQMLKEPDLFVSACCQAERQWLKWAGAHRHTGPLITSLTTSAGQTLKLVENLAHLLANGRLQDAVCLSEFVGRQAIQDMTARFPASAFRWIVLNLSICNHLGDTVAATTWSTAAEQIISKSAPKDLIDAATYVNVHFIHLHHNRFIFTPELPGFVGQMLALIEKHHRLLCENGYFVNKSLAGLHGSIAQNYGFCGPRYLPELEAHVRLAQQAFGGGDMPELDADWRRQFNYLAYAYLDAGDIAPAEAALMNYLDRNSWPDVWKHLCSFSSWQHAILSRFIADSPDTGLMAEYLKRAESQTVRLHPHHPWQLWMLHLGRMAQTLGDYPAARKWHLGSIRHCLSGANGPTVQVMALLPLAHWLGLPDTDPGELTPYADQARTAAERLNSKHFRIALSPDIGEILSAVFENARELFPFSYR